MRIVHVLDGFFPDTVGGTESYVYYISKEMQRLGHDVYIITTKKAQGDVYEYDGIKVFGFTVSTKATYEELTGKIAPNGLNIFIDIINQILPDIIHFHTFNRSINTYHLIAVKSYGYKAVFTAHQSGVFCIKGTMIDAQGQRCDGNISAHSCLECYLEQFYNKGLSFLMANTVKMIELCGLFPFFKLPAFSYLQYNRKKELELISQNSDCNIAISEWVYNTYLLNGVKRVKLVKQGVNPIFTSSRFPIAHMTSEKDKDRLRILYVGRIYPIKGLDVLCKALNYIDKQKIEVTFACICGNDEYANGIKQYMKALPYVNWYERVSSEGICQLMRDNDLLILPSRSEMSPLVVLEALACSLPVLGSNIAPITDIITHEYNGLVFSVNNPLSLAKQLACVIKNPLIINKLRRNIHSIRTLNDVASDLIKIYSNL